MLLVAVFVRIIVVLMVGGGDGTVTSWRGFPQPLTDVRDDVVCRHVLSVWSLQPPHERCHVMDGPLLTIQASIQGLVEQHGPASGQGQAKAIGRVRKEFQLAKGLHDELSRAVVLLRVQLPGTFGQIRMLPVEVKKVPAT